MDKPRITGLKKREQIKSANKTMFLWVIAASVAVAICIVFGQLIVRQFIFNNKIIGAKNTAYSTLQSNKESFKELKTEVTKLLSNSDLSALKVDNNDTALQVVIDALPTTDDRAGLGASLQQVVLARSGVTIESIGVLSGDSSAPVETTASTSGPQAIPFTLVINGNYSKIRQALSDLEHSIRPITIDNLKLEGSGDSLRATISATTYYLPAKSIENKTETIKP